MLKVEKLICRWLSIVLCGIISLCIVGCSDQRTQSVILDCMLEFDYGCTVEQAEAILGLTEADILVPYHEQDREITYDATSLGIGAIQLKLTVGQFADQNIGVDGITFYFGDDKESAVSFYEAQTVACEKKVLMEERKLADKETVCPIYRCYDWADYKDSAYYDCVIGRMPDVTDTERLNTTYPMVQSLMRCWMLSTGDEVKPSYECSFTGFHPAVIRALECGEVQLPK